MPLHPEIARILKDEQPASGPRAPGAVPIADLRRQLEARTAAFSDIYRPPQDCDARDISAGGIPSRIYLPRKSPGTPPLLLYFHGGGFVAGSLDSHDGLARELCVAAGYAVLSVGYRLAPEHKFPAAVNDGLAAMRWATEAADEFGADARRIMVGGDSAGGNIAAVTAIRMRDEEIGPPLLGQLLLYPVTDHVSAHHASRETYAAGFGLTRDMLAWYWKQYLVDYAEGADSRASPLRASSLADLPPACIVTAECDPLRDEGRSYAHRLQSEGIPTLALDCAGMNHGFMRFVGVVAEVRSVISTIAAWMRERADVAAPPSAREKARDPVRSSCE